MVHITKINLPYYHAYCVWPIVCMHPHSCMLIPPPSRCPLRLHPCREPGGKLNIVALYFPSEMPYHTHQHTCNKITTTISFLLIHLLLSRTILSRPEHERFRSDYPHVLQRLVFRIHRNHSHSSYNLHTKTRLSHYKESDGGGRGGCDFFVSLLSLGGETAPPPPSYTSPTLTCSS